MPESQIGRVEAYEYINFYVPGLLEANNSIKGLLENPSTSFSYLVDPRYDVELKLEMHDLKPNDVIPQAEWMGLRLLRKKGGQYWRVETYISLSQRNMKEVGLRVNYEGPLIHSAEHVYIDIHKQNRTMHLNLNRLQYDINRQFLNTRILVANGSLSSPMSQEEDAILQEIQKGGVVFYGIERGIDTFGVKVRIPNFPTIPLVLPLNLRTNLRK